jgi:hypothetical protein
VGEHLLHRVVEISFHQIGEPFVPVFLLVHNREIAMRFTKLLMGDESLFFQYPYDGGNRVVCRFWLHNAIIKSVIVRKERIIAVGDYFSRI